MSIEKMREEFESWKASHDFNTSTTMFEVWKASRESLVIELPGFDGYKEFVIRELQAAFKQAIEDAGLKVKP